MQKWKEILRHRQNTIIIDNNFTPCFDRGTEFFLLNLLFMYLKRFLVVLLVFFLAFKGVAQNTEDQEMKDGLQIQYTVELFLRNADSYREDRKQEYVLMILEIDTAGWVGKIHLLV